MKRALIELDFEIDTEFDGQYSKWKGSYLSNDEMSSFFDIIITEAYHKKAAIWDAILACDQIWVNTCYIGDSGRLLMLMLENAVACEIKDKKIVNMRKYEKVYWHLPEGAIELIEKISANNVQFIYADDNEYLNLIPQ